MRFVIALELESDIQNKIRRIVGMINKTKHYDIVASLLPQHISLKQAFEMNSLSNIEDYFDHFAESINPFSVTFSHLDLITPKTKHDGDGILWYDIYKNENLISLHAMLNSQLRERFGIPLREFDGDSFHFHSTVMLGGASKQEFEVIFDEVKSEIGIEETQIRKVSLFCSYAEKPAPGTFFVYKTTKIEGNMAY